MAAGQSKLPHHQCSGGLRRSRFDFYTYQQLIRLRHENDVIVNGRFEAIQNLAPAVMAYYRVLGDTRWLVVVNLSEKRQPLDLNDQLEKKPS